MRKREGKRVKGNGMGWGKGNASSITKIKSLPPPFQTLWNSSIHAFEPAKNSPWGKDFMLKKMEGGKEIKKSKKYNHTH